MASFIASSENSSSRFSGPHWTRPHRPGSDPALTASRHDVGAWSGLAGEEQNDYSHSTCFTAAVLNTVRAAESLCRT